MAQFDINLATAKKISDEEFDLLGYLIFILFGLGISIWLFFFEKKPTSKTSQIKQKVPKEVPKLLDRLGLEESSGHGELKIKDIATPPKVQNQNIPKESTQKTQQETLDVAEDPTQTLAYQELLAKCERLEKILNEKSQELEKKEKALASEIKARKDFNKVKDVLEKEIKEAKDKIHKTNLELGASQAESQNYKKRITQLEDKVTSKEKEILKKEDEIKDLTNCVQAAASAQTPSSQAKEEPATQKPPETEVKVKPAQAEPEKSKEKQESVQPQQAQQPKPAEIKTEKKAEAQKEPKAEPKPEQKITVPPTTESKDKAEASESKTEQKDTPKEEKSKKSSDDIPDKRAELKAKLEAKQAQKQKSDWEPTVIRQPARKKD